MENDAFSMVFLVEPAGELAKKLLNDVFCNAKLTKQGVGEGLHVRHSTTMRLNWGTFNSRDTPAPLLWRGGYLFHLR